MDTIRAVATIKILPDGRVIFPVPEDVELIASLTGQNSMEIYSDPVKLGNLSLLWSDDAQGWELKNHRR